MLERSIVTLHVVDPAGAESAALRDRLKGSFPPGAARRMTLLGMMVGAAVNEVAPDSVDALVYTSEFGESISLENYLRSFPSASPTLFQTSIHPSAPQQGLILRQKPTPEVIPLAGGPELVLHGALAALTNPAERVVWCGGEESGTWLRELGVAASRSFAFALALAAAPATPALGVLRLEPADVNGTLPLGDWFDILRTRRSCQGAVGAGWRLSISWA